MSGVVAAGAGVVAVVVGRGRAGAVVTAIVERGDGGAVVAVIVTDVVTGAVVAVIVERGDGGAVVAVVVSDIVPAAGSSSDAVGRSSWSTTRCSRSTGSPTTRGRG